MPPIVPLRRVHNTQADFPRDFRGSYGDRLWSVKSVKRPRVGLLFCGPDGVGTPGQCGA